MSQPIEEHKTCATCRHFEERRYWVMMRFDRGWIGQCMKRGIASLPVYENLPACSKHQEKP